MKLREILVYEEINWTEKSVCFWFRIADKRFLDSQADHAGTVVENPEFFGLESNDPLVTKAEHIGGFDGLFQTLMSRGFVRGIYSSHHGFELSMQCANLRQAYITAKTVASFVFFDTIFVDFEAKVDNNNLSTNSATLGPEQTEFFLRTGKIKSSRI